MKLTTLTTHSFFVCANAGGGSAEDDGILPFQLDQNKNETKKSKRN